MASPKKKLTSDPLLKLLVKVQPTKLGRKRKSKAREELGTIDCPICYREVTVRLTKHKRPFFRCGYCDCFVFYNGREGQQRLYESMRLVEESTET